MLRLFRFRKNIFSLGARVNGTQPETVRIQRVKFSRRRFRASNILISGVICYACYDFYTRTLLGTLGRWLDEEEAQMTEEERQELEDAAAEPIFIPFPGFTKQLESAPYRGTDPEWQAYVKISKNQALQKSIRFNLAEIASHVVDNHPFTVRRFGKGAKLSRFWLEIQYPYKPPPTFARQGLSIGGDDGIAWTEKPVDSLAVFRTRQALWPSAITLSLWSFTSTLMRQNAMSIATFFGYEPRTDPMANMQQTIARIHQQIKKQPGKSISDSSSLPSQDQAGEGSTTSSLPPVDKRSTGSTTTPDTMGPGAGMDNVIPTVRSAKDLHVIRTTQEHTSSAWDKFKVKFAQKWRRASDYPPRGSINVTGLVEISMPRAYITVDCNAWWDPETKKFDPRTLNLTVKTIRPKQQVPLR